MMNTIDKILGALRSVSLSHQERTKMRLLLQAHAAANPVRASFAERAYYALIQRLRSFENALNSKIFFTHPAFDACVLVLCISVGTSYAAQGALPGQALYSFKTRVNEPLQGALATTPAARAQWSAELTDRRLQEAEELAATNQLSPVAAADIETGLDVALQKFNSNIKDLSKGDDVEAANVQSDLEASLNAHEVVLASLPGAQNTDTSRITSLVRKHAANISSARSASEAVLTATDSPSVKTAALRQQKTAKEAVDHAQLLSNTAIDTRVASSVSAITKEATSDITMGDSDAKHGKWGKAYGAFQDAIRKMKETQDSVNTRTWLKQQFGIGLTVSATTSTSSLATSTDQEDKEINTSDKSGNSGDTKD